MPPKNLRSDARFRKSKKDSDKTIPLPVRLNNSSDIAEKYDNYLRMLCKEHPTTMRSLRNEKKLIEERKDVLKSQVQKIKLDIKEMQSAALQLDILYEKEIEFTSEKEKEINQLKGLIQISQERKLVLQKFIAKYECARSFLSAISTPQKFQNVRNLVEYYLTLETLNEQFLQREFQAMKKIVESQNVNFELLQNLKDHQFEIVKREKIFEDLSNQRQSMSEVNSRLKDKLSCLVASRTEDHENWEILKRWANDVCKKISHYKDITHSKDLSKHLDEVNEFIIAAKKIAKH